MSEPASARAVFGYRDFNLYILSRCIAFVAMQMLSVCVGWQIYQVTHRALDLGYVGLAQFLPAAFLSLVTGHVADRFERRKIVIVCYAIYAVLSLALCAMAMHPEIAGGSVTPTYVLLFILGTTRAFSNPAGQALLPTLVPLEHFRSAVAWSSSLWQLAMIVGPGLGGLLVKPLGVPGVFVACSVIFVLSVVCLALMQRRPLATDRKAVTWSTVVAGVVYVWENKMVLGAISLDLFAVLLGGAVALMPAFATDILHAGARGNGALRAAPSLGAAVVAILFAFRPLKKRAGFLMFACVFLFGIGTIVFGLSRNLPLSLLALVVVGASDMVSVVVRQTLIQLNTPEEVRGRVGAVNMVFIGASNELGEFESGLTAQWLGLVPAVVVGGIGTCLIVFIWAWLFPALRKADGLDKAEGLSST